MDKEELLRIINENCEYAVSIEEDNEIGAYILYSELPGGDGVGRFASRYAVSKEAVIGSVGDSIAIYAAKKISSIMRMYDTAS